MQANNRVGVDAPATRRTAEIPRPTKRVRWWDDWPHLNKVWWKRPQRVRILMYMDGASFNGGPFQGLQHAINAITSDPWPWATFQVSTANRYADSQADLDGVELTAIDLDAYDELWLFGIGSDANLLSDAEVAAVESFMDGGGGVFTTGDHANLGRGLSGRVKRVRDLRAYPAPIARTPVWNTTIRDANGDGNFSFGEQSDHLPQTILPRYRYHWGGGGGLVNLKRSPHPLLCADQGVIRTLPDHQHEGEVVIPTTLPVADWPKAGGYQARPEEVARARIVDPDAANTGGTFPVIGAYDGHKVDVGRIVADSTWHHWFDINMAGFDTASDHYRDIISYFQNVAAWLAPPDKQAGMRNGVFWFAIHANELVEQDLQKLALPALIPIVLDALGQSAPQCLVSAWLLDLFPGKLTEEIVASEPPPIAVPLHDAVLARAVANMQAHFGPVQGRLRAPGDLTVVDDLIRRAARQAAAEIEAECGRQLDRAKALAVDLRRLDGAVAEVGPGDGATNGAAANGGGTRPTTKKAKQTKRTKKRTKATEKAAEKAADETAEEKVAS